MMPYISQSLETYNFELAEGLTANFFVISNPTEGQCEKFRELKDLNYTYWNNLRIYKKIIKIKVAEFFFIGFADQVKTPTPVFPSREGKSEDKQPIGG